jgi:CRP-like cAMP-binding protein
MFIIINGAVDVRIRAVDGREIGIATLTNGDYSGEQALLPGASGKRNASVRSLQRTTLISISKTEVLHAIEEDSIFNIDIDSEAELIPQLLRTVRLFRTITDYEFERYRTMFEIVQLEPGEIVIRENEHDDCLYAVMEGTVEVFIMDQDGRVVILAELERGAYFGEQALLPGGNHRRNANVRTNNDCKLVKISEKLFNLVLRKDKQLAPALKLIGETQRKKIADILNTESF